LYASTCHGVPPPAAPTSANRQSRLPEYGNGGRVAHGSARHASRSAGGGAYSVRSRGQSVSASRISAR